MLVLSRQRNESIMIGNDIEVVVVAINGDKVRLGIKAPKNVAVHRKEIYLIIQQENRRAAGVKAEDLEGWDLGFMEDGGGPDRKNQEGEDGA